MQKIILSAVLGGLTLFVWGMLSWIILPFHSATMKDMPNEQAIVDALRANLTEPGIYVYPGMSDYETDKQVWTAKYKRGPIIPMLVYYPHGIEPMELTMHLKGLCIYILAAGLSALMLAMVVSAVPSYGRRILMGTMLGVFAALVSHFMLWNYAMIPAGFTLAMSLDLVVGWTLAGAVIGKIIKP